MPRPRSLLLVPALAALGLCLLARTVPCAAALAPAQGRASEPVAAPVGYGGKVVVHLTSMPASLNYSIENSAYARRMLYEVHEYLLRQDWESWQYEPLLCHRWEEEDMVVLSEQGAARFADVLTIVPMRPTRDLTAPPIEAKVLFGTLSPLEKGWAIAPLSARNPLPEPVGLAPEEVERVERRAVFTFYLREDVPWQPSLVFAERKDLAPEQLERLRDQRLDARDVWFSWSLFSNPEVDCGEKRFQVRKMPLCDVVDEHTVRIFYESQYFKALDAVGTTLTILPSHVYDLSDPDNPDHDPEASASEQARHINENPHNRLWVGLGPYQVRRFDQQAIEATRFEGYFDPERAGHVDEILWRCIPQDDVAFQALLNREIDFLDRITSENFLGPAVEQPAFAEHYEKGFYYLGAYTYTCWNLRRPQFAELAVRQALAMAFDGEEFLRGFYKGLGRRLTGPFPYDSPAYDRSVPLLPYDPQRARELLEEAGWYDRNQNGVPDKDGVELEFEFLYTPGNVATTTLGQKLQESFAVLGVRMKMVPLEWKVLQERLRSRDFDATSLAWSPPLESDPEMIWHSSGASVEARSSNYAGVADETVDRLIVQGQRELDPARRAGIWRELHARLYGLQPYLWHYNLPTKYALAKALHGFRSYKLDPGYSIRDWYYERGTPGTREQLQR